MKNMGGLMFWTMDGDDFKGNCHGETYPLIRSARQAFLEPSSPKPKPIQNPTESSLKTVTNAQSDGNENQTPKTAVQELPIPATGANSDLFDFIRGFFTILVKNSTLNQHIHITNIFNFHNRTAR
jgi:GH18 family chitinase